MPAKPESLGFSSARLQRIDRFFDEKYLKSGRIPNTSLLVARKGEIIHRSVQGLADIERGAKAADDTVYRIYSMTKPITSVALMMLVEEGKIALDDPVHRYIPAWRELRVYEAGFMETFRTKRPARPMLVVDLFRHTSGLTYGFQQRTNVDAAYRKLKIGEIEKHGTLEDMVAKLATLPLEFSPGASWNYSVSTDILGYLVQVVSGQKFEKFLDERLFKPLGMTGTGFHVADENHARFAANYAPKPGGGGAMMLYDDPKTSSYLKPPSLVSGGGGLVSTMSDYYRFCQMLVRGGELDGVRYLSPKTLALMTANHIPGGQSIAEASISLFSEAAYDGVGFGLGFSVTMDPAKTLLAGSVGDFAWGGAASTYFWIDPKEELVTIFLTQLLPSDTYPLRRELRTMVYAAMNESLA